MTAIWEHSAHKGNALLLMLTIADHASDDGANAWPSVRRLAQRTRMSTRTVQRIIQDCEASGELVVNRPTTHEHRSSYYTIRLDRLIGDTRVMQDAVSSMQPSPRLGDSAVTRTVLIEPSEANTTKEEAERLWLAALEQVRGQVTAGNYETWLDGSVGLRLDGGALVVQARPDQVEALETRFAPLVKRALGGRAVRFER